MFNDSHIAALLLALAIYGFLSFSYFGWGRAVIWFFGSNNQDDRYPVLIIWLGWAFTLFVFQLVYFVLPLTFSSVFSILIPGFIIGFFFALKTYGGLLKAMNARAGFIAIGLAVITLFICSWIASRSMLPPLNYDSGLYHFNKIRWINSFPIVLGLGNLHGRLAFNNSFFIYAASLNFFPFFGHGRSIANSYLFLLTTATFFNLLVPVFKKPFILVSLHSFKYTAIIFSFPALAYFALSSGGLASPDPDLASDFLRLTMFVLFVHLLSELKNKKNDIRIHYFLLAIMAVTSVTIKLSNIAFAAMIIGFVFFYAKKTQIKFPVFKMSFLSFLIIILWCFQSIILSGAPLYPSTFAYVNVDWAVPIQSITEEAKWVYSWARYPGMHWSDVMGNWDWIMPWIQRLPKGAVIYPLSIFLLFCALTLIINRLKNRTSFRYTQWVILFPSLIGLVFWFFTAPDPRFALACFYILAIGSAVIFLLSIQKTLSVNFFLISFFVVFFIVNLPLLNYFCRNKSFRNISVSGWHEVKTVPLIIRLTESGLLVYTPKFGDKCWDSPLPSTPYFNPDLRLRNPGDLSSGFLLSGMEELGK